jgi:hypothetical protein
VYRGAPESGLLDDKFPLIQEFQKRGKTLVKVFWPHAHYVGDFYPLSFGLMLPMPYYARQRHVQFVTYGRRVKHFGK